MAAPSKSRANMKAYPYELQFNAETCGYMKDVDPSKLEFLVRDQAIEELNGLVVDKWIYGIQGIVSVICHESTNERLRQLSRWAGATGAFSIGPTTDGGYSMYANAAPLIIHPRGVSGATEDFQFAKAFPLPKLRKMAGGKNWNDMPVDFVIFHDLSALENVSPTVVAGYAGALPA